ncbi:Maf family protein [Maridesulfovibrio sp. FT414]|uniref:Maf family protein n=1 Tax=Maridesulfovibrio sp. FT414 TaxID=2979469 RepID=UPI003D80024D
MKRSSGAYATQGQGAFFGKGICGSHTNVVGLQLARVIDLLINMGIVVEEDNWKNFVRNISKHPPCSNLILKHATVIESH